MEWQFFQLIKIEVVKSGGKRVAIYFSNALVILIVNEFMKHIHHD